MAREGEEKTYSIKELPPEVQKKALERWRYKIWDDHDSQFLTETFQEILSQRGLVDPKVYWSLSSSQGDGVAFSGALDLPQFLKWTFSGDLQAKPYKKEARKFIPFQDVFSVQVIHENRYYHSHSMNVQVEVTGSEADLVPEDHRDQVRKLIDEKFHLDREWLQEKRIVEYRRNEPIREWNRRMDEHSRLVKRGPKEWRPPVGPRPEPLDIPLPPEPVVSIPPRLQRMVDKARGVFAGIDPIANELETFLSGWVRDTSRELEKIGYDEIEYRESDEYIIDFLYNNEFEFDEDGEDV